MATTTDTPDLPRAALIKRGVIKPEHGASGTPNFGGYITGVDFNPKLDGKRAMRIYDEMRVDGQVQAILLACKLPIKSASWEMHAPDDGDNTDLAIADFCKKALFDDGAMVEPWGQVLSHLLLRLDFGVSAVEKVWTLGDDGRLRFERLAPRLPQTFERFQIDERGMLTALDQYAYRGPGGQFGLFSIPAEYLMLTVHNREGDNYWGRSLLRAAYKHWYLKDQFYRIDAVRHDRWGIGIPEAKIDDQANLTDTELAKIDSMLEGMRGDQAAYIRHPKSIEVDILVPQGGTAQADSLGTSIDHHDIKIAQSILAGFMTQGSQKHGSFGLGSRLADFFTTALEALAAEICHDLKTQVVKPLCDVNFPMQGRQYPTPVANGVSDSDMGELADVLQKIGKDFVTPDDSLEDMLRTMMGAPPLPDDLRGRDRTTVVVPSQFGQPALPPNADGLPEKTAAAQRAARRALRLRAYTDPISGRAFSRAPTPLEDRIFALRDVPNALDRYTDALIDRLTQIRRDQLARIVAQAVQKDGRETAAHTDVRPDTISLPLVDEIERAIKDTQQRVFAYGGQQVQDELRKQGASIAATARGENIFALADVSASANKRAAKSHLVTSAQVTSEKLSDTWYGRILDEVGRERRTGTQGDALEQAVLGRLSDAADVGVAREARAEVNEAFGLGRATEASAHKDDIAGCVYSAILDANTCEECEAADGEEFAYGSEEYFDLLPPNKDCEGRDACRCVILYLYEGAS